MSRGPGTEDTVARDEHATPPDHDAAAELP